MNTVTVRNDFPRCAFCRYWNDPTNMYIEPKAPNLNQWAYDSTAKCKCLKRGTTRAGGNGSGCRDYSCKIPLN